MTFTVLNSMDWSVLWCFGWLLWLTLSSRVTNSGNMAHLSTMITCLVLESAIVWCVWVSSASIANFTREVRRRRRWWWWGWFAVIWDLVNSRFCVQLTVQFRGITNGSFHRYGYLHFSFASESKRLCICIFWRPQTNLSRKASLRFAPKLQWVASFFSSAT